MNDKVIYEKWENGEKVTPSGWQQIIITPKGEKKTVTENKIFENDTPLYPARQWIGLTNNEIEKVFMQSIKSSNGLFEYKNFARAIEQALRSKNS